MSSGAPTSSVRKFGRPTIRDSFMWIRNFTSRLPRWLVRRSEDTPIPVGKVDCGDLRRLNPLSRLFGYDRGLPVDRYYIERFLAEETGSIRGRVLEVGDDCYTRRFGGDRVTHSDVLHVHHGNPQATIVADLSDGKEIPSDCFDCVILTQTLHVIYDVHNAIRTLHRILKPGGILLATVPGISQIDHYEWAEQWYWSFTTRSSRRLFGEVFSADRVTIQAYGNVRAATAFLYGLATEELRCEELDYRDRDYELLITAKAIKERC